MTAGTANETQPLLGHDAQRPINGDDSAGNIVDFDDNGDAENPMDWPPAFKWAVVALLAAMSFTVTFTCISVVPLASLIVSDLSNGQASKSASVLLVTIWELGEAAGPLVLAPLSEVVGRYPVMNGANVLFIAAVLLSGLCRSVNLFIAARCLTGLAVTSNVLNPAIVGDMFAPEQRGTAMSLVMLAPLIGGAIGPAIGGAIAQSLGWRAVVWISAGLAGACEVLFLTCFRETYKVPILRRKAARLREETGNHLLRTEFDKSDKHDEKGFAKIWDTILRPAVVLADSLVLMALSLYGSIVFAFFYVLSVTLADILQDIYGLSPAATGSAYMSFSVGSLISILISNMLLDRLYVRLRDANKGIGHPEYRLPLSIVGGFTLPISVVAYGWVTELRLPLPLLLLSVAGLGLTLLLAVLPIMAYVVDGFGLFAASATTGVIISRCLMGTFLPLTTAPLVEHLGYGWGFTVLGGLSLSIAPIPVLLMKYGSQLRQRSQYTKAA